MIEALIALLVVAVGALAIGHFSNVLMRHAEVARHRTEAALLAQAKLDELRRFTQLVGGAGSYAALEDNSDTPEAASNTRFERRWQVGGSPDDLQRRIDVHVDWTDRDGHADPAGARLAALVARAEPADEARVAMWSTAEATRRALGRSLDIPLRATRLSGANHGRSVLRWGGASAGYLVFDDTTGLVIAQCESAPGNDTDIAAAACRPINALLLSGHLSGANALAAIDVVIEQPQHLVAAPECQIDNAVGPDGQLIAGVRTYRCLMRPGDHDGHAGTPRVWSGRAIVLPQPVGTQRVCRYTRIVDGAADGSEPVRNADHPAVYTLVSQSLAHQNFALIAAGACPEGSVPHQPG